MSLLTAVKKHLNIAWQLKRADLLSVMEYRASFFTQLVGMFVNDIGLVLIWFFFFQKFPSLNGWSFQDTILLYAITTIGFGVAVFVSQGALRLAQEIAEGKIDYYLSLPINPLWHISFSKSDYSALGDILFGLVLMFFYKDLTAARCLLILISALMSGFVLANFVLLTQSLSFYFGNFERAAAELFHALVGCSLYPQNVFSGLLRLVMLTVLPAFFFITLPVNLVRDFSWEWLGYLAVFCAAINWLARKVFSSGLRRYESGNMINVRS